MTEPGTSLAPRRRGRPRQAPEASATRRALLRAGLEALTERGFTGVSVDEILQAAGLPKGAFYHHFAGKEAFGLALIAAYGAWFAGKLEHWLTDADTPPLERLRNFTADARAGMARHGYRRGCLVGNLGQEIGSLPEPFRAALLAVLADWERRTAACLAEARARGDIASDRDPESLAALFWIGWEGAVLRAKLERAPGPLTRFADGFLDGLRPPARRSPECSTPS
ncbi:TetR/AcrR family transcriptional regulator [Oceanicella sp. SM1341]|uniref:acrylate utilization transcriptional regulator AcuR n=1 Tax=Oceanicella sp. SM1341 TaxID=1548889 RepID=UPI000E4961EE|nr:TetR/AcrR family transcriptional regulator [Oceanicella sp. SM1341]